MRLVMKDGSATAVPTWAVAAWSALIGSLIIGGFWLSQWSQAEDERRYQIAKEVWTNIPGSQLRACLGRQRVRGLSLHRKGSTWQKVGDSGVFRAENSARHIRVDVADEGAGSRARFYTREGKPLRPSELLVVAACAAGPQ